MNVQLAVFNQGSKQGLSVSAAGLSRLKRSQAHKATSAQSINYSEGLLWTILFGTDTSSGQDKDKTATYTLRVPYKLITCISIVERAQVDILKNIFSTHGLARDPLKAGHLF